jgi:hypothetical protein
MPGYLLYGIGIGFGASQLTNVILEHIPSTKTGVVSGANTTARQVGMALGVAVMGALLTAQTIRRATAEVKAAALATDVKDLALSRIHALGTNFAPPPGASSRDLTTLRGVLESAVGSGARFALVFAAVVVMIGAMVSFLIPRDEPPPVDPALTRVERFEAFEPLDVDPALVEGSDPVSRHTV